MPKTMLQTIQEKRGAYERKRRKAILARRRSGATGRRHADKLIPVSDEALRPSLSTSAAPKRKNTLPWWKQVMVFFGWKPKILPI